jgi:hypothetical protein
MNVLSNVYKLIQTVQFKIVERSYINSLMFILTIMDLLGGNS